MLIIWKNWVKIRIIVILYNCSLFTFDTGAWRLIVSKLMNQRRGGYLRTSNVDGVDNVRFLGWQFVLFPFFSILLFNFFTSLLSAIMEDKIHVHKTS